MTRNGAIASVVLAVILTVVPAAWSSPVDKGDRAPLFSSQVLDGETFDLKDEVGKRVILLNFWSVFCRDCLGRLEAMNKISDLYQKRNFEVIGVCGDPPTERMLAQVRRYAAKMHFRTVLDPDLNVFTSYGVESIPFAVLIDTEGKVAMAIQSLDPEPIMRLNEAVQHITREP